MSQSHGGPLEQVTSLKLKLGLLVAASVTVASVLATLGAESVPPLLSIPVTVVVALGVTQLLATGMTAPLRQMTLAARRMAAGDYDVRVETGSTDEVGELARAFNRMAAELATVDRQRRDLVATVSHELRTPLSALVAVLENLVDGVGTTDPATLSVALGQAERLGGLVEDLLDLSRVDAGVVPLERENVHLAALVGQVVAEASTAVGAAAEPAARGVAISAEVPGGLVVAADPRRLHQLIANLLDNAVRHSPAGGTVRVVAGTDATTTWLEVSDEGPGIDPVDRERVFERYGTASTGGGTGLGLAIARWVADLHGGRIALLDPADGVGARCRVELPTSPPPEGTPAMSTSTPTSPQAVPVAPSVPSLTDGVFGSFWRERAPQGRPWVVGAALLVGLLAAVTLPFEPTGLATTVVLLAAGGLAAALSPFRRDPFSWACGLLAAGFAVLLTLRAAEWIGALGFLAALALVVAGLTRARSFLGLVLGGLAWPLSAVRGLPWLGRSLRGLGGARGTGLALARTFVLMVLGLLVFGALFASADAIFGHWVQGVVPDVGPRSIFRAFVTVAVTGVVLATAYLALNPPEVEPALGRRPLQRRFEWLAPVLAVDAVFVLFLLAQAAAYFGGHDYVLRTTGLTYADYVHQGFAQLTIATALTLLVVRAAASKARLDDAGDRLWLRVSLGALCLLTLVVVASALHRMALYQDAYGYTALRLVVDTFELWLGVVVVGVLAAGFGLRGWWVPRAALLSGAAMLLALGLANPDAWIARHNIERYHATGKVDWDYLRGLSADAVPILVKLPDQEAGCILRDHPFTTGSWTSWNLGRQRARDALHGGVPATPSSCPGG